MGEGRAARGPKHCTVPGDPGSGLSVVRGQVGAEGESLEARGPSAVQHPAADSPLLCRVPVPVVVAVVVAGVFGDGCRVGKLHGKMSSEEKADVLASFVRCVSRGGASRCRAPPLDLACPHTHVALPAAPLQPHTLYAPHPAVATPRCSSPPRWWRWAWTCLTRASCWWRRPHALASRSCTSCGGVWGAERARAAASSWLPRARTRAPMRPRRGCRCWRSPSVAWPSPRQTCAYGGCVVVSVRPRVCGMCVCACHAPWLGHP